MTANTANYLKRLTDRNSSGDAPTDSPLHEPLPLSALLHERREIAWPIPAEHLDPDATHVVRRLAGAGHETYFVGGCVRDLLFGLRPKDFDVVTSATPRDVKKLFRNCRIIGRRFRLAHVLFRDKVIEVATFRAGVGNALEAVEPEAIEAETLGTESLTTESLETGPIDESAAERESETATTDDEATAESLIIRDDNVFGTAEQDAVRRDFTVNALFYDVERQVIVDYVSGVSDVERRIVRTIGDPYVRMREDPIRMLRAIRLAARLNCQIDPATWNAIELHRNDIVLAAAPRILEDILRMFRGGAIAPAFDLMLESGVLEVVLPQLHAHLRQATLEFGTEEVEALRRVLLVADAWTHSGRNLTTAVQLALLVAPAVQSKVYAKYGKNTGGGAIPMTADLLREATTRISMSKRDSERVRQILLSMPRLLSRGRRRRGSAPLFKRPYFPEMLDLFELLAHASGDRVDEVGRWRQRQEESSRTQHEVEKRPRRRRRRR